MSDSNMTEREWDRKLHIDTCGREEDGTDENHYPYEPTPYSVLERLAAGGYLTEENYVLDYGCGKGRVCFFLAREIGCRTKGIDYSAGLIGKAENNLERFSGKKKVCFERADAAKYEIEAEDAFFFFNPFSETILKNAIGEILWSWYENPRKMRLFFYYPSDEFLSCLMTESDLVFLDEIDCRDLFEGENPRERILIFETV